MNEKVILTVDDTPVNNALIKALLRTKPYTVISACSGPEALEKIDEYNPDLVLLDVMMPEMDGYDVLVHIRSNPKTKDLKVIMLTALTDFGDTVHARELGANAYLTKPVVLGKLLEAIEAE